MRATLLASATVFLAFTLACGKRGPDEASDTGDGGGWFEDVNYDCSGVDWVFEATTYGSVESVEVETWLGNDQLATQDLLDRGAGDWYREATSATLGADCADGAHLVFRGYRPGGGTFEDSL